MSLYTVNFLICQHAITIFKQVRGYVSWPTAVLSMEGGVTQELRTDGTYWVL